MKNLYRRVNTQLLKAHKTTPSGHELKRLNNLSGLISGMIRKGNSHLPDIGSGLPQNIYADSKTVAAKRFVGNKWTDMEVHYLPYLFAFLKGFISTFVLLAGEIILVIDGSQMGKDNAALMVSLVWRKRSIPICWLVKSGSKGHFTEENHLDVLKQALSIIKPLLPDNMPITILGDGEFDGIDLQKCCLEYSCNYVLRTACNTLLYKEEERFQGKYITPDDQHNCLAIHNVEFTKKRFRINSFVCWHDKKNMNFPYFLLVTYFAKETSLSIMTSGTPLNVCLRI